MKNLLKNTTMLAAILGLSALSAVPSAPAMAQEAATSSAGTAAGAETVDIDPALWVVKDEDTTIYLFGTIHVLRPGLGWFDEAVKTAFDESDELVLEIIEPDPAVMQQLVMSKAIDSANPLRGKLTDEQKTTYEAAMASLGVPAGAFDQFDPWFAAISMSILPLFQAGYDVNSGAEKVLTQAAIDANKTVGQLETPEQQLGFFDGLPEESQINFLIFTAQSIDDIPSQVDSMVDLWGKADTQNLAKVLNEGFTEDLLYDTLLTKRNVNWANWIDNRLDQPGTVFIAVGAGHLAGKDSVQAKLKDLNIESSQIEY